MRKMKEWFIDKWHWLQTFNNMPRVTINCNNITVKEGEGPAITLDGRALLIVNGDLIVTPKEHSRSK